MTNNHKKSWSINSKSNHEVCWYKLMLCTWKADSKYAYFEKRWKMPKKCSIVWYLNLSKKLLNWRAFFMVKFYFVNKYTIHRFQ
jgi:hypothetical protein